jgi:uncharacterized protein (UPF0248 family)
MRAVTSGTAAFVLGIPKKDLDNILSRHTVRGFERGTRGLARRISLTSIEQVAIAIDLTRDFSIPIHLALTLAEQALASREGVITSPGGHLAIHADLDRIRKELHERLAEAIEHVIPPRRGRPAAKD